VSRRQETKPQVVASKLAFTLASFRRKPNRHHAVCITDHKVETFVVAARPVR
jgi:hypothetical protein